MLFLIRFLNRNLKGYRFLVILAMLVTVAQVGSDLLAAMPLKFIPSKVNNPGSDPACTFPFLDPVLTWFDSPILDPSLRPTAPNQPPGIPPPAPCPAIPSNPNSVLNPQITQHSVIGVIVFSLLILFLTYLKMLYQPMRDLSKLTTLASNAASGAERIQEVLSSRLKYWRRVNPMLVRRNSEAR